MKHIFCAIVPIVVVGLLFQLKAQRDQLPPSAEPVVQRGKALTPQMLRSFTQYDRDIALQKRVRETFTNIGGEDFQKLVEYAAAMPIDEIGALSSAVELYLLKDGEAAQAWLFEFCQGLVELGGQERALDITSYLQPYDEVPDVERRILHDWSENSWDQVTDSFSKIAREEEFVDGRQVAISASLALNERNENFDEFVHWVAALDSGQKGLAKLQGTMIEKLAIQTESDSETFKTVVKLFEENLDNERALEHLPKLAMKMGESDPEKALEWVSQIKTDDNVIRRHAYAQVMQELALNDVDKAAEVLSSENFIENYYRSAKHESAYFENGELRPEAKEFYDETVSAFMEGLVSVAPDIVLDSVDALFSKEKKEEFTRMAQALIASPPVPKACPDPNCKHTHHD